MNSFYSQLISAVMLHRSKEDSNSKRLSSIVYFISSIEESDLNLMWLRGHIGKRDLFSNYMILVLVVICVYLAQIRISL